MTLHPLTLGSSHSIAVGDELAIVGDPLGFNRSLSTGVVSGLDRTIQAPSGFLIAHSIQTDAAINPGSARGPLLDPNGRVIGIADQIATGTNQFGRSSSETSTGVGFAVPIDLAKIELPQLKRGPASHPTPTSAGTAATAVGGQRGAVAAVPSGTPAAESGRRAGDPDQPALTSKMIRSSNDLIDAPATAHAGEQIQITGLRGSNGIKSR